MGVIGINSKKDCKTFGEKGFCENELQSGEKVFEVCQKSCNACQPGNPTTSPTEFNDVATESPTSSPTESCRDKKGDFKVKGITKLKNKTSCKQIKKKQLCNKKQKNGQPLFVLCPISCETFCEPQSPTTSPTESPTQSPTISPTSSPTSDPTSC